MGVLRKAQGLETRGPTLFFYGELSEQDWKKPKQVYRAKNRRARHSFNTGSKQKGGITKLLLPPCFPGTTLVVICRPAGEHIKPGHIKPKGLKPQGSLIFQPTVGMGVVV